MGNIKQFYFRLVNVGVDKEFSSVTNKQIKFINIITLTAIHIVVFFSMHDYILNVNTNTATASIINVCIMSFVIFLNHIRKINGAKIIWLVYNCINVLIISLYLEPGRHAEYFLLLFPVVFICLFDQIKIGFLFFFITFFLFSIPYYIIPVYPIATIEKMQIGVDFSFSACLFLLVVYLKTLNQNNEKLLFIEKDKVLSDKIILEEQQKELKLLTEFKSHFFVNLSHEIRTPLTLIKGYRDELDFNKTEIENKYYIDVIDEQLKEITNITDNILDLSKLDANKIILNKEKQSINHFLQKIYADFKPLFEQKNIDFEINLLDNDIEVFFDFDLMVRGLGNIVNNALKFTSKNGKVILTTNYSKHKNLLIKVTDNGIGISKEELNKVFDRFYQTKNHISKSKGSGIGLAFTKSIVKEHGFNISVKSKLSEGTTFEIKINKELLFLIEDNKYENNNYKNITNNSNVKTILLVDDHQQMRFYIKNLLKNYTVLEAENGKQALEIIKNRHIDLLITDYMMPVMDGWDLIKKTKELKYTFPIFIITARVDSQGKLKMLRLGIDHYFTKPFYKEELLLSVQKSLRYYQTINNELDEISSKEKLNKKNADFENKLYAIISENIMSPNFGVEDIADFFNISSKTLTRKTKLYFGQTPNELIIEYKLLKAKESLDTHPELGILDIAQQVGFKNASYLKKRLQTRFEKL